ncbi:hypothetical protein, partial [Cloacibacillus porcorum]
SASAPIAAPSTGGSGAVIPTAVPVESSDISVAGAAVAAVTPNVDAPAALAQAVSDGNYAGAVTSGDSFGGLLPLCSITLDLDHAGSESADFTIEGFDYTTQTGGALWAMVRKKAGMGGLYDIFPATLTGGTLRFTITGLSDYFTENTVVIAETTPVEIPDEPEPWSGDGAGTGGCETGAAAVALLAFIPLALRRW